MLAFAYAHCGLTVDEFFNLSFYEWSLEIYKVRQRNELKFSEWESNAVFVRDILAMMINTTPRKDNKIFEGKDFYALSFDKKEVTEPTEDIVNKYPKELKNA